MSAIITTLRDKVPQKETREEIYRAIIPAFEDHDWDTQNECEGEDPAFDSVIKELHPEWDEDDA